MLTRGMFNALAVLPVLGFVLFYAFLPVAICFGDYEGSLYWNDPKNIGLTELYDTVRDGVLPCSFVLAALALVVLGIVTLFGQSAKLSTWSMWTVVFTLPVMILLLGLNPGGYVFWFFD